MITELDTRLLHLIHDSLQSGFANYVMPVITSFGNGGVFWIAVALLLLIPRRTRKTGAAMAIAMLLCLIFGNLILKPVIARPRPYSADPSIVLLIPPSSEPYSFPSGHTMNAFSAAFAMMLRRERLYPAALVFAALIALSRIYLMMHYPLDIVGGVAVGFAAAWVSCRCILPKIFKGAK